MNYNEKTVPQYFQGMSVLQYARQVNIPNTTLRTEIKFIK